LDLLTDTPFPRLAVHFGKGDSFRAPLEVEAEEFIPLRSVGTKGKRLSNYTIDHIEELEPTRTPAAPEETEEEEEGDETQPGSLF
jgi:topoisomerase-4 subunit A